MTATRQRLPDGQGTNALSFSMWHLAVRAATRSNILKWGHVAAWYRNIVVLRFLPHSDPIPGRHSWLTLSSRRGDRTSTRLNTVKKANFHFCAVWSNSNAFSAVDRYMGAARQREKRKKRKNWSLNFLISSSTGASGQQLTASHQQPTTNMFTQRHVAPRLSLVHSPIAFLPRHTMLPLHRIHAKST